MPWPAVPSVHKLQKPQSSASPPQAIALGSVARRAKQIEALLAEPRDTIMKPASVASTPPRACDYESATRTTQPKSAEHKSAPSSLPPTNPPLQRSGDHHSAVSISAASLIQSKPTASWPIHNISRLTGDISANGSTVGLEASAASAQNAPNPSTPQMQSSTPNAHPDRNAVSPLVNGLAHLKLNFSFDDDEEEVSARVPPGLPPIPATSASTQAPHDERSSTHFMRKQSIHTPVPSAGTKYDAEPMEMQPPSPQSDIPGPSRVIKYAQKVVADVPDDDTSVGLPFLRIENYNVLSPASEPMGSPMDVDPLSNPHPNSEPMSYGRPSQQMSSTGATPSLLLPQKLIPPSTAQIPPPPNLGIRIPSWKSSVGSPESPMPHVPSGLDLPIDSFRSRDNSTATNLERGASYQSRGSTGRARLRADYDKIYNRTGDAPPASESQIKIAGGELFVDGNVEERWKFRETIGEGGFSTVYRAERKNHERYKGNVDIPRVCAIKVIVKRTEPFNRRMVEREVFSYRLLEMVGGHENIVKLFEVSEDDRNVYLVMELLKGGELFSAIAARGQYTEHDAANLVVSMLAALCFCHRLNLTHRDVKPENFVFLKPEGRVGDAELKLTDFGIAHYSEDPEAVCRTMCGTPLYIAPEVLFRQPYGAEADLWSLGVIVYIMLVGYPPFHDHDMVQLVKKIKYKPVSFEGPQWALISEEGKDFLGNLLDKDRSNRMTAQQALEHEWLVNNCQAASRNVLQVAQQNIKSFNTRKRWQSAVSGVKVVSKLAKVAVAENSENSGASNSGLVGDVGNFTVATEDTLAEPDMGSLWARLRRDRPLQSRRPRSRTSSRISASRDRAARLDAVGDVDGTPRRSDSDGVVALQHSHHHHHHHHVTPPTLPTSSMSSSDARVVLSVAPERRRITLWKSRRERSESQNSEPNYGDLVTSGPKTHPAAVRPHQSHHVGAHRARTRFRLFRSRAAIGE